MTVMSLKAISNNRWMYQLAALARATEGAPPCFNRLTAGQSMNDFKGVGKHLIRI
jgi:hypothetical protein